MGLLGPTGTNSASGGRKDHPGSPELETGRGSTGKLELWWADTESGLLRAARRRLSAEGAEDAVQDVAVLAVRHADRFSNLEDFRRWAHARLHWLILDRLFGKAPVRSLEQHREPVVASAQDQALIAQDLMRLITALPPRQYAIVRGMLEGRETKDLAREMGVTEATIRSLQRFARQRLAALLAEVEVKK